MNNLRRIVCLALVLVWRFVLRLRRQEREVTLNVLNWGDYIDPTLLRQFEDETASRSSTRHDQQ
jgi:spermidine/putrescine-binding protein